MLWFSEEWLDGLGFFDTPSGRLNVETRSASDGNGRAVLCIHGFCCDARIFKYATEHLVSAGYNVYSLDLPGHGSSPGPRGDLDFEQCLRSIDAIISEIKKKNSKVFILAHSMGSTFALWYAHRFRNSIDGLVLLTPYIRIPGIKRSDAEPSPGAFVYMLLGRIFSPGRRIDIRRVLPAYARIGGSQYLRMVDEAKANFGYSFRYLIDVIAQRNSKLRELSDVHVPVFILYGLQDRNVYPQVSEEFFKLLKSECKKIESLNCNHWFYDAIFYSQSNDYSNDDRRNFMAKVIGWMDLSSKQPTM